MPWNRKESEHDPFEEKRRKLAEQERLLAEQMSQLNEKLHEATGHPPAQAKSVEPPVWRMEEDEPHSRAAEPTPARKRNLARQRQRDMVLFFVFIIVLIILVGIVWYVAYVHNAAPNGGA